MNRLLDKLCCGSNRTTESPYEQGKRDFFLGVEDSPFPIGDNRRKQYYDGFLDARHAHLLDKSVAAAVVAAGALPMGTDSV